MPISDIERKPRFKSTRFECPRCGAFAQQHWSGAYVRAPHSDEDELVLGFWFSFCGACSKPSVWHSSNHEGFGLGATPNYRVVFPIGSSGIQPHPHMPEVAVGFFEEAVDILELSPRASAAMSRLAMDEICKSLGAKGRDFKNRIEWLVKDRKIDSETQKLLTVVRCFGNDAIHNGGEIVISDSTHEAFVLLQTVNDLVNDLIARPARTQALFEMVPERQRPELVDQN